MVSKARKAARDRAFSRKGGRPPGAVPLRKDARRFEVAMFHMLTQTRLRGQPTHAAEFAAGILHSSVEALIATANNRISFDFTGGRGERVVTMRPDGTTRIWHDSEIRTDAGINRRDKILREARGLIAGATGPDRVWLEVSARLPLPTMSSKGDAAAIAHSRFWHFSDMTGRADDVRSWRAGSTGRRNTGIKSLCWRFKLQGLTWPFV
jgi:hypothetical protein